MRPVSKNYTHTLFALYKIFEYTSMQYNHARHHDHYDLILSMHACTKAIIKTYVHVNKLIQVNQLLKKLNPIYKSAFALQSACMVSGVI